MSRFMIESKAKKSHSKLIRTIFIAMIFTLSIPRSSGETNHLRNSLNNCILQIRELIKKIHRFRFTTKWMRREKKERDKKKKKTKNHKWLYQITCTWLCHMFVLSFTFAFSNRLRNNYFFASFEDDNWRTNTKNVIIGKLFFS